MATATRARAFTTEDLGALYRVMQTIRRCEEHLARAHARGLIHGACHTYVGQEAIAAGVCSHLRPDDAVFSTHRGHGHALAKGVPPRDLAAELFGRATGCSRGRGGSMHLFAPEVGMMGTSGIVGPCILQAAGAGYSFKLLGNGRVAVAFFGDGAVNNGAFHEGLNLASIGKLPVLFVCENNGFATEVPFTYSSGNPGVANRAASYGLPGVEVDGNDVLAVSEAAKIAVERARTGGGATLIECKTYRTRPHAEGMGDYTYRTREEVDGWKARCPIRRLRDHLIADALARRGGIRRDRRRGRAGHRRGDRVRRVQPLSRRLLGHRPRLRGPPADARAGQRRRRRARAVLHEGDARSPDRRDGARPDDLRAGRGDRPARRQLRHDDRPVRSVRPGPALRHADLRARVRRPRRGRRDDRDEAGDRLHVRRLRARRRRRDPQPDRQDAVHEQRPGQNARAAPRLHRHRPLGGDAPLG